MLTVVEGLKRFHRRVVRFARGGCRALAPCTTTVRGFPFPASGLPSVSGLAELSPHSVPDPRSPPGPPARAFSCPTSPEQVMSRWLTRCYPVSETPSLQPRRRCRAGLFRNRLGFVNIEPSLKRARLSAFSSKEGSHAPSRSRSRHRLHSSCRRSLCTGSRSDSCCALRSWRFRRSCASEQHDR